MAMKRDSQQPVVYEGDLVATDLKVGIVVSRFNELVTERLLEGALDAWRRHGGAPENIEIARVPGAFEIPLAARTMAEGGRYQAVVCLGCVIRGATSHYDYVCAQAASGVLQAGLNAKVPVIFGILTTDTLEQAFERAGSKAGNKGADALLAAVEMARLLTKLRE